MTVQTSTRFGVTNRITDDSVERLEPVDSD